MDKMLVYIKYLIGLFEDLYNSAVSNNLNSGFESINSYIYNYFNDDRTNLDEFTKNYYNCDEYKKN